MRLHVAPVAGGVTLQEIGMTFSVLAQPRSRRSRGFNRLLPAIGLAAITCLPGVVRGQSGQPPITSGLYTDQSGRRFSNITPWNFTQGFSSSNPTPFSSASQLLIFQGFGN